MNLVPVLCLRSSRLLALLLVACSLTYAAVSPSPVPRPVSALQVQLVRSLNIDTLHVGDTVFTKLKDDWTDGTCKLGKATVLEAHVVSLDPAPKHRSVALSFHYTCPLAEKTSKLIWLALLAPPPTDDGHRLMTAGFHSPSFGGGGGLGASGNEYKDSNRDMSGRQNATMPLSYQDADDEKGPDHIKTGEVWKLSHLRLDVGKGPDDSSLLSSSDKQIHLPTGSILVLLPESAAYQPVTNISTTAPLPTAPRGTARALPPELGSCRPPACTTFTSPINSAAAPVPIETIPLGKLGYGRLRTAEMLDLDFGAAVAFLGDDQLLFTFNSHNLVSRQPPDDSTDRPEDQPHMVRAVLFDRRSGRAERTEDWRVPDSKQYLWIVDGEHVVVHDGNHLRWIGPGLLETASLKLPGPLAWFEMSPDRQHYAVAVVRELHTAQQHAILAQDDAAGPEEEVLVTFLDSHLKRLEQQVGSSRSMPPILLSTGHVELRRTGTDTYFLRETPWPTTNTPAHSPADEPRAFARTDSACIPRLQSLTGDLILEEGCRTLVDDHWIRVFHPDGSPVLESVVHWREFSLRTADSPGTGLFSITTAEMDVDHVRNSPFHGADLARETIRVHRSKDGHEIFAARLHSPLPARQPVAISPAGDQIAVIDGDNLLLYATSPTATPGPPPAASSPLPANPR